MMYTIQERACGCVSNEPRCAVFLEPVGGMLSSTLHDPKAFFTCRDTWIFILVFTSTFSIRNYKWCLTALLRGCALPCLFINWKLLQSVTKEADGTLTLTLEDEQRLGGFDQVLVAAGREPIIDTLGLDSAGVKTDRGYITVRRFPLFVVRKQRIVYSFNAADVTSSSFCGDRLSSLIKPL